MSKNYAIIIHFVLPLTTFYRSGAHRSDVYKWDAFVTSWRFYNRAWQPQRHDRLPETSGTLWIHRGALTNQRCSLATGCGIKLPWKVRLIRKLHSDWNSTHVTPKQRRKQWTPVDGSCHLADDNDQVVRPANRRPTNTGPGSGIICSSQFRHNL